MRAIQRHRVKWHNLVQALPADDGITGGGSAAGVSGDAVSAGVSAISVENARIMGFPIIDAEPTGWWGDGSTSTRVDIETQYDSFNIGDDVRVSSNGFVFSGKIVTIYKGHSDYHTLVLDKGVDYTKGAGFKSGFVSKVLPEETIQPAVVAAVTYIDPAIQSYYPSVEELQAGYVTPAMAANQNLPLVKAGVTESGMTSIYIAGGIAAAGILGLLL
jgi:hypothetical protein